VLQKGLDVAREGETPHRTKTCFGEKSCGGTKRSPPPGGGSAVRRWRSLRCSGYDFLQVIAFDGCSFSGLRKNQRGPEGVSQFIPPGDTPSGLPPFPRSCEGYWVELPSSASQGRPVSGLLRWSPCAATERRTPELLWRYLSDACFTVLPQVPGGFPIGPPPLRSGNSPSATAHWAVRFPWTPSACILVSRLYRK